MRIRTLRRAPLLIAIAVGPSTAACELFLEFDRTPLQPAYEAGSPDAPAAAEASVSDAKPDRLTDSGSSSSPDVRETSIEEPEDAGDDAEGD
jgi:hypothetical protein